MRFLGQRIPSVRAGSSDGGLGRSAVLLAVASLAVGSISFAFIFVGSRLLSSEAMAELLSLWAIMNTTVLSLIIPLETLAPRILRGRTGKSLNGDGSVALLAHGGLLGVAGGAVSVAIYIAASGIGAVQLAVAGFVYCAALGVWSGMRARLVGTGLFGDVLGLALATTGVALATIGAAYFLDADSGAVLLGGIATSYLVGLAGWRLAASRSVVFSSSGSGLKRVSLGRENYRMLVTLIGVTFATLILNNGGLVFAGFLDVDARTIVVYAAALNLVRIPIMLINNVTPPINLRMVELAAAGATADVRRLAVRTFIGFSFLLSLGLVVTWILGPLFVGFLVGDESEVEGRLVALVLIGEGLIWLTVVPRIVCVAMGSQQAMVVAWTAGLVSFAVWMLLPIPNDWKVIGGPIVGGLVTLTVGLFLAWRLLSPSRSRHDGSAHEALASN